MPSNHILDVKYPVHERFLTFQGEGVHMGKAAFFVRLFGCPLRCPWCDSAGTWHPDYVPKRINKMTVEQIVNEAKDAGAQIMVITGGEPLIHDLAPLTTTLRYNGFLVHLETSGAFPIQNGAPFDWITVSPKMARPPIPKLVDMASEFKIIVENEESIQFWTSYIYHILYNSEGPASVLINTQVPIWLHPEWSKRDDPKILTSITEAIIKNSSVPYRAGWQIHKLYRADLLDERSSKKLTPLGGNLALGY